MKDKTKIIIGIFACVLALGLASLPIFLFISYNNMTSDDFEREKYDPIEFCDLLNIKYNEDYTPISGTTSQVSQEDYTNHLNDFATSLYEGDIKTSFLPTTIPTNNTHFYFHGTFKYKNSISHRFEFYLSCEWDKSHYESEINRLENVHSTDIRSKMAYPFLSNDTFKLPSFIMTYNYWSCYEYAILDEENYTIHYIYLEEIGTFDDIVFDKSLAPTKRIIDTDLSSICFIPSYNIFSY